MTYPYPVKLTASNSIDQHLKLIREMVRKSVRDPEVRQLAVKLVSGAYVWKTNPRTGQPDPYVEAWRKRFIAPSKDGPCPTRDDECEVLRLWDFVVLNFRYVYDPDEVDTFATAKLSLEAGGGDCDDATILFCALAKSLGFFTKARVISVSDDPENWVHVYPLVGLPKDDPAQWVPLDMTVTGYRIGDEYPDIGKLKDFEM